MANLKNESPRPTNSNKARCQYLAGPNGSSTCLSTIDLYAVRHPVALTSEAALTSLKPVSRTNTAPAANPSSCIGHVIPGREPVSRARGVALGVRNRTHVSRLPTAATRSKITTLEGLGFVG